MAQKGVHLIRGTYSCSICLDVLKNPVTTPCGHNYCMNCLKTYWTEDGVGTIYSCPQCRKTFTPRPVLMKNTMLTDLLEELKKAGLQAAAADHCYAGAEDVSCDVCTGRKLKASKCCLVCRASYCEKHLQPHYESLAFKIHKLVEPSKQLQEIICQDSEEGDMMTKVDALLLQLEPETREEFLRYSRDITVNPRSVPEGLFTLSECKRKVTKTMRYPEHPAKLRPIGPQMLSNERLTGRCYWEVEWTGRGIFIAVEYETGINGWPEDETFGLNDKSWSFYCFDDHYGVIHNKAMSRFSGPLLSRVGVYLDHGAGTLSFYRVSETMTLLQRVQTTFTEPLHAGVKLYDYNHGVTAEFCKLT